VKRNIYLFIILIGTFLLTVVGVEAKLSSSVTLITGLTIGTADSFNKLDIELRNLVHKPINALKIKASEWSEVGLVDIYNKKTSYATNVYLSFKIKKDSACEEAIIYIEINKDNVAKKIYEGKISEIRKDNESDHDNDRRGGKILLVENLQPDEFITLTQKVKLQQDKRNFWDEKVCKWDEIFQAETETVLKNKHENTALLIDQETIAGNLISISEHKHCKIEFEHDDHNSRHKIGDKLNLRWKPCHVLGDSEHPKFRVDIFSDDGEKEDLIDTVETDRQEENRYEWTIPEKYRGKENFKIRMREHDEERTIGEEVSSEETSEELILLDDDTQMPIDVPVN
jgi:hypothetical protein